MNRNWGLMVLFSIVCADQATAQIEGEDCYQDGVQGVCKLLRQCPQAIMSLRLGKETQKCENSKTLICCLPSTTETMEINACPPIRKDAVKVQKTGQKAWDKCIDWIEYVLPCGSANTLLLDSPRIRIDKCSHNAVPLIVGGMLAGKHEFPHIALLGYNATPSDPIKWSCAGTLISERWIMTAAHCLYNRETDSDVEHVRLGSANRDAIVQPELLFSVAEIIRHPDYHPPKTYNDIALLKLDRDVKLSSTNFPACLHVGNEVNDSKVLAIGWGTTQYRGEESKRLLKVALEKFEYDECSAQHPPNKNSPQGIIDSTQLCIGHHTEFRDTCQGDSGGPVQIYNNDVYCTYTVVGITSFGNGCGTRGYPAIYTRVANFIPWIEQHVWP